MNFLPIILTFITLITLFNAGFWRGHRELTVESKCYRNASVKQRGACNQIETKNYNKAASKKRKKSDKGKPETKEGFFRDCHAGNSKSRLNIGTLTKQETWDQDLYELAVDYLIKAYGHTRYLSSRAEATALFDLMLEALADTPDFKEIDFEKLSHYRLKRGTIVYDLKKEKGFPSLHELFTIRGGAPINFRFAPSALLELVLGEDLTATLCSLEENGEATKSLPKSEFEKLLNATHPSSAAKIRELFRF